MTLALVLVALILGAVEVIRSKAQSILAWAVVCLALSQVWPVSKLF